MKPVITSIWVLIGLLCGLGFGGYVYEENPIKRRWNLMVGAGVGVLCGFGVAHGIFETSKDEK
jgi:hypothetical protein